MKNIKFSYKDDLCGVDIYWFSVTIEDEKDICVAKDMDGENYTNSCFSIILIHDKDDNEYTCDLIYVPNEGGMYTIKHITDENIINKLKQLIA